MRQIKESIGTYAAALRTTRDVLRRVLNENGVQPCGQRSGHPLYAMSEVFGAVMAQQKPETLNPHARHALARAIKVEDEIRTCRGELVSALDVEQEMGAIFKLVVRAFDTATDNVERDVGLSPSQAAKLERHFGECRENLYQEIINEKKGR